MTPLGNPQIFSFISNYFKNKYDACHFQDVNIKLFCDKYSFVIAHSKDLSYIFSD